MTAVRVSRAQGWLLATLCLAGCGSHSFTAGLGGSSPSSSGATATSRVDDTVGATKDVYGPDGRLDKWAENGRLWTQLAGYTVDEARARAKQAGHNDRIEVGKLYEYDPACKAGTVCRVDPQRWEIDESSTLTLWVNKNVEISTPE